MGMSILRTINFNILSTVTSVVGLGIHSGSRWTIGHYGNSNVKLQPHLKSTLNILCRVTPSDAYVCFHGTQITYPKITYCIRENCGRAHSSALVRPRELLLF